LEKTGYPDDPEGFFVQIFSDIVKGEMKKIRVNQIEIPHLMLVAILEQTLPGHGYISIKDTHQLEKATHIEFAEKDHAQLQQVIETYPVWLSRHTHTPVINTRSGINIFIRDNRRNRNSCCLLSHDFFTPAVFLFDLRPEGPNIKRKGGIHELCIYSESEWRSSVQARCGSTIFTESSTGTYSFGRKYTSCLETGAGQQGYGVQLQEISGIHARLAELLRDIRVLSTHPGNRRMAPPPDTDVLLETVALCPDQSLQLSPTGNFQKTSHHDSD
jgi:hypothetical protein